MPLPNVDLDRDINALVAGTLRDMAEVQASSQRKWGYKQAANAIRYLESSVEDYIQEDQTLRRIPRIGPASSRVIFEVVAEGRSATVERAVDASGKRAEVERRRRFREHFLSRAMALAIVSAPRLEREGIVTGADCLADFQMHSTWSDGYDSIEALLKGCLARGYTHAAITDHSAGLPVAGGLSPAEVAEQAREIDQLNAKYAGEFRFLKGIEANIRKDGEVDVDSAERSRLDVVVAAPHSGLRLSVPQTDRLVVAVTTPGVHILGHPRGRMYNSRAGLVVDWAPIFAAAARSGVAIEIDGDPSRQDLDYSVVGAALDAGCLFALDSDAHGADQLDYAEFALAHARLAGIPAERIVNCWPLDRFLAWAQTREGATVT